MSMTVDQLVKENLVIPGIVARRYRTFRDTDDLIGAGSIGLWKAARYYVADPQGEFSGLAFRCVQMAIVDHLRYLTRHQPPSECAFGPYDDPAGGDVESEAVRAIEAKTVVSLVAALPPREREVVRRHYWGGENGYEIARSLGISGTRERQIHMRALGRLRLQVA